MWFRVTSLDAIAHQPVIQNEVYELLVKGGTEPSTAGAGFYSNVSCSWNINSFLHIRNLMQLNGYILIATLGCLLSDKVWHLIY